MVHSVWRLQTNAKGCRPKKFLCDTCWQSCCTNRLRFSFGVQPSWRQVVTQHDPEEEEERMTEAGRDDTAARRSALRCDRLLLRVDNKIFCAERKRMSWGEGRGLFPGVRWLDLSTVKEPMRGRRGQGWRQTWCTSCSKNAFCFSRFSNINDKIKLASFLSKTTVSKTRLKQSELKVCKVYFKV